MSNFAYLLGIICVFVSLYYLTVLLIGFFTKRRWRINSRLDQIRQLDEGLNGAEPLNLPFQDRIVKPGFRRLGRWIESLTPTNIKKSLSDKLSTAGYTQKADMTNFIIIQIMLVLAVPMLFIFISMIMTSKIEKALLFGLLGLLVALLLPSVVLNQKKLNRQNLIRKSLPDALDLLVVSVEAGLGFDMALMKVTEKTQGILADEFENVLNEIKLGKVRRVALREMALRTGVDELISFVSSIVQADQLGVSVGNVLRVQADSMRNHRRQKIEETAAKAPIQMLFPLIFCIFPAMFAVLLGPAVIQFMDSFVKTR